MGKDKLMVLCVILFCLQCMKGHASKSEKSWEKSSIGLKTKSAKTSKGSKQSNVISEAPSDGPSIFPSSLPTLIATTNPSQSPSDSPSKNPSIAPSLVISEAPSDGPSIFSSSLPTLIATTNPSQSPSDSPSKFLSTAPSFMISEAPSYSPSSVPSFILSDNSSGSPTIPILSTTPSFSTTSPPTVSPTQGPTGVSNISCKTHDDCDECSTCNKSVCGTPSYGCRCDSNCPFDKPKCYQTGGPLGQCGCSSNDQCTGVDETCDYSCVIGDAAKLCETQQSRNDQCEGINGPGYICVPGSTKCTNPPRPTFTPTRRPIRPR